MTTDDNTPDAPAEGAASHSHPTDRRPLGAWLRIVDALLTEAFAEALDDEDVSRRDWMILNALAGEGNAPWVAQRLARRPKHVRHLADRGWVTETDATVTLTDEGRAARDRLAGIVDGIRARVTAAAGADDLAVTMATLERIAREFGFDDERMPRGPRGPFGRRFGRGPFPGARFAGAPFGPHRHQRFSA